SRWANEQRYPPVRAMPPNSRFHLTAARLRIWMNVKSSVWAAAGDRQRWIKKEPTGKSLAAGPWAWQARHAYTVAGWRDTSAFVLSIGQSCPFTSPHGGSQAI